MISEAAKKAAERCYDNTLGISRSEDIEYMGPIIQSAIDAETDAALEMAAKECDAAKQTECERTPAATVNFERAAAIRDVAIRIRALKQGSAG